ncbi:MAG TPA: hypothetical protein VK196_09320 [Magnetospirillum sp.]|nr:hypothetical protein [Magnetospirillum sp.]
MAGDNLPAVPGDFSGPHGDILREIAQLRGAVAAKQAQQQKAVEYQRGSQDASAQWGQNRKKFDVDIFRDAKARQQELGISHLDAMIAATEAMQQGFQSAAKANYDDPYTAGLMVALNTIAQDYFTDKLHELMQAQHQQILRDEAQARQDARQLALQRQQEELRAGFVDMERKHHASILEQIRFAQAHNNARMGHILSAISRLLEG